MGGEGGAAAVHSAFCILQSALVPKVSDFGLAKRLDGPAGQTQVGEVMGTPSYMAPEQAEGRHPDVGPHTDVWALGAILYECLTGRPPFLAGTIYETLEHVRTHDPAPPRTLTPGLPHDLEVICLKCLEKAPARRYASAADLAADLSRYLAGAPIVARPSGRLERIVKWAKARPTAAALVLVTALLVVVLASAIPLHVLRLQSQVQQISAAMQEAHQESLRADCERKLAEGQGALTAGGLEELERAVVLLATVQEMIDAHPEMDNEPLRYLRDQAIHLREQATQAVDRQIGSAPARARARKFLHWRDEAFFQLHHDLLGQADADRTRACLDACVKARRLFPDLDCLPSSERPGLRTARQEVLLLEAEATARLATGPDGLKEALELVDQAAGSDGHGCGIHLRRARYLGLLGDQIQAARERRLAGQTPPVGALDWFLLGHERWLSGDLHAALTDFDRALGAQPELFWPRLLRAIGLRELRRLTEARAELDLCVRARPTFPRALLLRALIHVEQTNLDAAETDLIAVARLPLDPPARYALYNHRGVLALARLQPQKAVAEFQRAVLLAPRYYHGYANLAQGYRERRQLDRAEATLSHAIRLAPQTATLYRARSRLHTQRGNLQAALADLDRVLALEPAHRPPVEQAADLRDRAQVLYALGRYSDALPACARALLLDPTHPAALRLHAEALLELGHFTEAVAAFDRYLTVGRADVELYRRRARARASIGDLAGVIDDYTLALALRRDPALLAARGWAHLVHQTPRMALRDFEAALRLRPGDADALVGRGTARFELGETRLAVADVEKALAARPQAARVLYNAARLLARAAITAPRGSGDLRGRAAAALQLAVQATPAPGRGRFWQEQVCRDEVFRPLTATPAFEAVARQVRQSVQSASSVP